MKMDTGCKRHFRTGMLNICIKPTATDHRRQSRFIICPWLFINRGTKRYEGAAPGSG